MDSANLKAHVRELIKNKRVNSTLMLQYSLNELVHIYTRVSKLVRTRLS